jgi:hypothetical protein
MRNDLNVQTGYADAAANRAMYNMQAVFDTKMLSRMDEQTQEAELTEVMSVLSGDILPTLFACLVLDGLFACRRHADSHVAHCRDGAGQQQAFFSLLDWPALEPQSTTRRHMKKRGMGRPLLPARTLRDHGNEGGGSLFFDG